MKVFITFGQVHVHTINDVFLDKDCVACFLSQHTDPYEAREEIFKLLEGEFHQTYFDELPDDILHHYPRGVVEVVL